MFDLNATDGSVRSKRGDAWDRAADGQKAPKASAQHPLDKPEADQLHRRLMGFYRRELDRQYDNRIQQSIDADFYDHIQFSEEDANELKERGQAPVVYNVIAQSVNWVIGSEKRGRVDFKILPRTAEDSKPAERKTELLKYLSDVNRTPFHRSRAFEDATKVGIGWLEDGVQDEDDDAEPLFSRYESWRNMIWDSSCTELDLSDARYVIRSKWVDEDVAVAMFPSRAHVIRDAVVEEAQTGFDAEDGDEVMDMQELELGASDGASFDQNYVRGRVRLIEVWYRKPTRVKRVTRGEFRGETYDKQRHAGVEAESISERMQMSMHVAIMTTGGLLFNGMSPYRHNRFPFTPIWGYRRDRDGLPYGMIRGMRDIQDGINKRASKALYILSTNKVIMDEGAVEDVDEFREEVSRPDAVIIKKIGKELTLNVDRDLAPAHLDMMARDIQMLQSVGGVTDEQMGRTTNAVSGAAITARQEQGAMSTSKLFDNLRFAHQLQGEIQLSLTEQFVTEEKVFRITNERGVPEFKQANTGLPEDDITSTKADFVISEGEWRASMRQAQAEQLMEMLTRMPPEVSIVLLDLVVDVMDLPNREEIVKRIRAINQQRDPDATEITPEEQARMQAQAQQQEMQQKMLEAELREKLAKAGKTEAEAARAAAEIIGKHMGAMNDGIAAAQQALMMPAAAKMADKLLREAGFTPASVQQAQQESAALQQQAQQEQAAMAQQQQQQQAMAEQQAMQQQGGMPM